MPSHPEPLPEDLTFHQSSYCGNLNCVEVAAIPSGGVAVRDNKDTRPGAPILTFTSDEWTAFLRGAAAGEFEETSLLNRG